MNALSDIKRASLLQSFIKGKNFDAAAKTANVSRMTSYRHYQSFVAARIPRVSPKHKPKIPHVKRSSREDLVNNPPKYTGPTMIGKAITKPDKPVHNGQWVF